MTWKLANNVVADGRRRLAIWKKMTYLIQGSANDIVADRDPIGRWDTQICTDSGGVLAQFGLFKLENLFSFSSSLVFAVIGQELSSLGYKQRPCEVWKN